MNVIICKNYEEVSLKASEIVIGQLKRKPNTVLGLATGSTPIGLYQKLIEANKNKEITFEDVETYNLDEYIGIELHHPQSYHQFMMDHLFSKIDIKLSNTHLPKNDVSHMHEHAKSYNKKLSKTSIDLQILGIGSNGHIGFNEPGTPFGNETFIVELEEKTRKDNMRFFNSLDEVPKYAITMGIKNIMKSKHILLLASGKEKSDAIERMIFGPVDESLPASILQLHPHVTVILDEKAAEKYVKHLS
jgi:glucosamine-6-phosphate deaminase